MRCASFLVVWSIVTALPGAVVAEKLRDEPVVWYDDDKNAVEDVAERDPNHMWDMADASFFEPIGRATNPARLVRGIGTIFGGDANPPAANVNTLDEVPNSTWFTNRIGLFPMTEEEAARGPGSGKGPDQSAPWTIVRAKTQGVTPGFNIRDARGEVYVIKFDPPGFLNMTTAAGVVSNRILHASGYNVPEDVPVIFRREDIVLGDQVKLTLPDGTKRIMRTEDIDAIFERLEPLPDGRYLALSSKFLSGKPVGPFNYRGRRKDDPNDRIPHQHRRELRGFRLFAAWIDHFDTKQHNSLDMLVTDGDKSYVKHYFIDFASTLGGGAQGPVQTYGYEFGLDLPPILWRTMTLGFHQDAWRRLRLPEGLKEVGFWESKEFDPLEFKPAQPNNAFANMTWRDSYWAAKIITAFTNAQLAAIVHAAGYMDPAAETYVTRILQERRDKIGREIFDEMPPLDFFIYRGGNVYFRDLGAERGIYPRDDTRYRFRASAVSEERHTLQWSEWEERTDTIIPVGTALNAVNGDYPFIAIECKVNRGGGWSETVRAFISPKSERTLAVER